MKNDFDSLPTTQLGDYGEHLVAQHCIKRGYTVQKAKPGPHLIDFKLSKNGTVKYVDVKTKASMIFYGETGLDLPDWHKYVELQKRTGNTVLLVFVDWRTTSVYGQDITILAQHCRIDKPRKLILFPLKKMRHMFTLSDEDIAELKTKQTMAPKYKKILGL